MKKTLCVLFVLIAAFSAEAQTQKILVAYFSRTGTTATIAGYIHEKAGGDIFRITTVTPYSADYNATLTQSQQELSSNARPALSGSVSNMDAYDIIFLGYPIWHGYEPMAIRSFLASYNLSGKTIIPFCTSGSSGIGGSVSSIRGLASGATVLEGRRFAARARADVNAWIDTLNIVNAGAKAPVKIRITIGNRAVTATMFDNVTAREFIAMLPLTLTMDDHFTKEKYSRISKPISATNNQTDYRTGDLVYWQPDKGIAIYYRHDGNPIRNPGITVLGHIDGSLDVFRQYSGSIQVTFELVK
jgi:flavodoxin